MIRGNGRQPRTRVLPLTVAIVLAFGLATATAYGTVGAKDSPSAQSSTVQAKKRIAVILPDFTANELILDQKNGAQAAAKKAGATLTITGSGSPEVQVRAAQTAIASKVDAIVYNTTDAKAFTAAVKAANAAGIPIVCSNSCAAGGKNDVEITFDYRQMGLLAGRWLASRLPSDGGKLGIVDGIRTDSTVQIIYKGLFAGIKTAKTKPKIVISPPTNYDPAKALTISADFLTANPDLDVLLCLHDLIANACQQSMNAAGYKDIPLSGLGGTCQGFANMLFGRQDYDVAQFLFGAGYRGVINAVALANGKQPKNVRETGTMIGLTTASIKAYLSGKKKDPPGLGLLAKLKRANNRCR